jgi:hypothetical protein
MVCSDSCSSRTARPSHREAGRGSKTLKSRIGVVAWKVSRMVAKVEEAGGSLDSGSGASCVSPGWDWRGVVANRSRCCYTWGARTGGCPTQMTADDRR